MEENRKWNNKRSGAHSRQQTAEQSFLFSLSVSPLLPLVLPSHRSKLYSGQRLKQTRSIHCCIFLSSCCTENFCCYWLYRHVHYNRTLIERCCLIKFLPALEAPPIVTEHERSQILLPVSKAVEGSKCKRSSHEKPNNNRAAYSKVMRNKQSHLVATKEHSVIRCTP